MSNPIFNIGGDKMEDEILSIVSNKIDNKIKDRLIKIIELYRDKILRDEILKVRQMLLSFSDKLKNLSNSSKMEPEEAYKTLRSIFLEMEFTEKETNDMLSQIMLLNKDGLRKFLDRLALVFIIIVIKIDKILKKIPDNKE